MNESDFKCHLDADDEEYLWMMWNDAKDEMLYYEELERHGTILGLGNDWENEE